jgi:hypothetical protein
MTKLLPSILLVTALMSVAGCDVVELAAQSQTGSFDRTLTVPTPVALEVRTGSGEITIHTGPGNTVHIVGHIRASGISGTSAADRVRQIEQAPPIEQLGSTVRIGSTGDNELYHNVSISYDITVPADTQIQSKSGSGDQVIASVRGAVSAQTGSGSIDIAGSGGDVRAQTGSGSIHARAVGGAIRAQTGSGDIEMAQTVKGDVDVQTGSGSVRLTLAENASFELSARTGSGDIRVAQPMTTRSQSRHRLEGTVGNGGARVTVQTGSGSITIR